MALPNITFQYGPDTSADCTAAAATWREWAASKIQWAEHEEARGDHEAGAIARRNAATALETAANLDSRARVAANEGR